MHRLTMQIRIQHLSTAPTLRQCEKDAPPTERWRTEFRRHNRDLTPRRASLQTDGQIRVRLLSIEDSTEEMTPPTPLRPAVKHRDVPAHRPNDLHRVKVPRRVRASDATTALVERAEHGCNQATATAALPNRPQPHEIQELRPEQPRGDAPSALPSCTTNAGLWLLGHYDYGRCVDEHQHRQQFVSPVVPLPCECLRLLVQT